MLVLGLLLVVAAGVLTVGAIYDAGETATVEILGQTLTTTAAGVFIAGLVTMLLFLVGLSLMSRSVRRANRRRVERKEARRDHEESLSRMEEERAALREENARLARELEEQRTTTSTTPAKDDERVVDHTTDLRSSESTPLSTNGVSGRHRDPV